MPDYQKELKDLYALLQEYGTLSISLLAQSVDAFNERVVPRALEVLKQEPRTVVLYESPHRLVRTLKEIREVLGEIQIACARELTKMFEETRHGSVSELIGHFEQRAPRGEMVLIASPANTGTQLS